MRERKKGTVGAVRVYTTRAQALKKLQLSLADFRRLCILKGIYPQEPNKKFDGPTRTYYLAKDIRFLAHEPLLAKMRELRAYKRKVRKARAKNDQGQLRLLLRNRPTYRLHHIILERYPTFADALRDIDDAITMVHLFAQLPSDKLVKPHRTKHCEKLVKEFQHFVAATNSLEKVFVSIKGIYYSARIMGEKVVWVVPHRFTQEIPDDVDLRVMLTFLELYECLLSVVNFKLYSSTGMTYPPKLSLEDRIELGMKIDGGTKGKKSVQTSDKESVQADAETVRKVQASVANLTKGGPESDDSEAEDEQNEDPDSKDVANSAERNTSEPVESEDTKRRQMFANLVVFLGRETPVSSLRFVLKSFGAKVGWEGEGSPFASDCAEMSHWIMDRPAVPGKRRMNVEYVQPQWIFDCVNTGQLIPTSLYNVGQKLPPHLSPFVDDEAEGYKPKYRIYLERLRAGDPSLFKESALGVSLNGDDDDVESGDDGEMSEEYMAGGDEDDEAVDDKREDANELAKGDGAGTDDVSSEEEVEADSAGNPEDEKRELAKMMMSKKKRNLYDRMVHGKRRRSETRERLVQRREELESAQKKEGKKKRKTSS
eukprot:Plantae.Rhodophyta-Purpureofilum_apyrenoidigerum.ctg14837.p1 GENE.Plantae.Rhodophyta-Purpureofilum_apyrenoidigerum.ctg14837~~Plantae.Rhodophyta-Purpureofilum_apyrenoidigerum.ctg14837.p1  ORF type:complete len:597 (-),score=146.88 Plantae.Rhodophyta-Purpureofilum_apyrenoidigerum.ctg14837:43-1833(-)